MTVARVVQPRSRRAQPYSRSARPYSWGARPRSKGAQPWGRGAQFATVQSYVALDDKLCGRAHKFKVDPLKKGLFLCINKELNLNETFAQDQKLLH